MYIKRLNNTSCSEINLFCFHYAGGSVSAYHSWKDKYPTEVGLFGMQLPARGDRFVEDAIVDMEIVVSEIVDELKPYLCKPFVFFGHSMGGVVAYGVLRKLEELGYMAKAIIISASKTPEVYSNATDYLLSDEELKDKLKKLNATPQEILENDELMELVLPIYRADLELLSRYNISDDTKLKSKAYIFNSKDDIPKEQIMQWSRYFVSEIVYKEFEGGHFFINTSTDKVISTINDILSNTSCIR